MALTARALCIGAWQRRRDRPLPRPALGLAGAGVALYNGYFGAGSGILLMALLALTVEPVLRRANAIKNVVQEASVVTAAWATSNGLTYCLVR